MNEEFVTMFIDEEKSVQDRGLRPFRTCLIFHVKSLEIEARPLQTKFVITCEKRSRTFCTEPIPVHTRDDGIYQVNKSFRTYHVAACMGEVDNKKLGNSSVVRDGEQLKGLEPIICRITVRETDSSGTIVDWAVRNLATFLCSRRCISATELHLKNGSLLCLEAEAHMWDEHSGPGEPVGFRYKEHSCSRSIRSDSSAREYHNPESALERRSKYTNTERQDTETCCQAAQLHSNNKKDAADDITSPDLHCAVSDMRGYSNAYHVLGLGPISDSRDSACPAHTDQLFDLQHANFIAEDTVQDSSHIACDPEKSTELIRTTELYRAPWSGGIWEEEVKVVEIDAPVRLLLWRISGPREDNVVDNGDEMMDIGGGVMAPKRDVEQLRAAMLISSTQPGPRAKIGRISPLQKSSMVPMRPAMACTIDLGMPVSLTRSTVLAATRILAHDVKYIGEPALSDSCSDVDDDEDTDDMDSQSGDGNSSDSSGAESRSTSTSSVSKDITSFSEEVGLTRRDSSCVSSEDLRTSAAHVGCSQDEPNKSQSSIARADCLDESRRCSHESQISNILCQLKAKDNRIQFLQLQLDKAQMENVALRNQISLSQVHMEELQENLAGVQIEERYVASRALDKYVEVAAKDDGGLNKKIQDQAATIQALEIRVVNMSRNLYFEHEKSARAEKEVRRLLEVMLKITGELDSVTGSTYSLQQDYGVRKSYAGGDEDQEARALGMNEMIDSNSSDSSSGETKTSNAVQKRKRFFGIC